MKEQYTYDIAFSFLQEDEKLAIQLNSLIKDRVKTFLYSEQQKKLAGRDGEELFNKVFQFESRIVVVLYRNNWGKSPWTKIEETAIRNRGFDHGYDFVTFIPLDKPVNPPVWLPKNRLWIGLERWGIESGASVIEARIQEFGGEIKVETIIDQLQKAEIELKNRKERDELLSGNSGDELCISEFHGLAKEFKRKIDEIIESQPNLYITTKDNTYFGLDIICHGIILSIQLYKDFPAYVFITLYRNDLFDGNKNYGIDRYKVDINEFKQKGWSDKDTGKNFKTNSEVIEKWLKKLFDLVYKDRKK